MRRRRPCPDHYRRRHHHHSPIYSTSGRLAARAKRQASSASRAERERARQASPRARRSTMLQAERRSRARAEPVQSARGASCLPKFGARARRRRQTPRPMAQSRSPLAARKGLALLPRGRTRGALQIPARPPETNRTRVQSDRMIPSAASEPRMTQPHARRPQSSSCPGAARNRPRRHSLWSRRPFHRVLRGSAPSPRASSALDQHRCVARSPQRRRSRPRHRARARA